MTLIGDVTGQDIVLIDDICDTAGTLAKAAALIMERGANSVRAVCTHPYCQARHTKRWKICINRTDSYRYNRVKAPKR